VSKRLTTCPATLLWLRTVTTMSDVVRIFVHNGRSLNETNTAKQMIMDRETWAQVAAVVNPNHIYFFYDQEDDE
jgi:hypothetical protein